MSCPALCRVLNALHQTVCPQVEMASHKQEEVQHSAVPFDFDLDM